MSSESFPFSRQARRVAAVLIVAGAGSCARELALPAVPDGARPAFTLSPSSAFAGQPLVLQFSGPAVDLSRVTVSLAGQVVHPLAREATRLVVETPLLAGACERELHLAVDSAAGPLEPVVFTYLGAGHPGRPRPSVVRADRVSFVPSQFVAHGKGATVASAYGTLMLKLTPDLEVGSAVHVDDFIAALSSLSEDGTSLVAWAGTFGTFGAVGVGLGSVTLSASPTPPRDYDTVLPSILYDGVSSLAASSKNGAAGSLQGLVLGLPGGPPPVKIDLAERASQSSAFPLDSALSAFPSDAPVRAVIGRPSTSWAAPMVRGGRQPAVSVAGFNGRLSASTLNWESPVAVTPRALESAAAGDARYYLAVAWHADEPVGAAAGALSWLADDALMVVEVTAKQSGPNWPGKIERFGAASTGRAVDAAAVYRGAPDGAGTLEVFTVDGEQPFLQRYSVDNEDASLTPVLVETVPLGAVGWRVVAERLPWQEGPFARVTVVDRDGAIHQLDLPADGGPLRQVRVNRIPVGVASLSPRIGPSCSDAPAVLGAGRLDSAVVMPLRGGSAPAFLPATRNVRAVEAIELSRPDGQGTMTWFASGGSDGFQLDETIVQRRALTHAVGSVYGDFETRALAVLEDGPTRAWLVAGGPEGLTALQVTNGLQPGAGFIALPPATAACPDVVQLVAAGERVVALSRGSSGSRLCAYDPRTATVVVGPVLPWEVRGVAAAIQRDRDLPAGQWRVFMAGREGGSRALVLAAQTLAELGTKAPTPLAWGPTVADLLPGSDLPVSTLGVSPDARRLFIGFGGEHPGLLTVDPWLLGAPGVTEAERRESVTSLGLSGQPRAIGFTADGARAIVVQDDDVMAVVE